MCIYNAIEIILRWKKIYYMLKNGILKNSSKNILGVLQADSFKGISVLMALRCPAG